MQRLIQSFCPPNLSQQYVIAESMQDKTIHIVNDLIQINDFVMRSGTMTWGNELLYWKLINLV